MLIDLLKNFYNLPPWRIIDELVDESLAVHLGEDAPLVVISESAAHGLVVHVWLVLVEPPKPGHGLGVHQLEDAPRPVGPLDVARARLQVLEKLQQELPQVRRVT